MHKPAPNLLFLLGLTWLLPSLPASAIEIVDGMGRTVVIDKPIHRIYTTSPVASIYVYSIAPETLVGWNFKPSPHELKYILPEMRDLPAVGGWFGKNGTANLETLLACNPDVILSFGTLQVIDRDFADRLQEQTGIPVILADAGLDQSKELYDLLGLLLDKQEEAEELANYCLETLEQIDALAAAIPDEAKVSVYYAEGLKGLQTDSDSSMHTECLRRAGANIVCHQKKGSLTGRQKVSIEQVILWAPEAIIVSNDMGKDHSQAPEWFDNPLWATLPAFQNQCVYTVPNTPFN